MLVLERKLGDSVIVKTLQGIVRFTFLEARSKVRIKIGVDAPTSCLILREELDNEKRKGYSSTNIE